MTVAIEVEKSKNASFRDNLREFPRKCGSLNLDLSCGAWASGCIATGREKRKTRKCLMDTDIAAHHCQRHRLRPGERRSETNPASRDNTVRTIIARAMNILGTSNPVFSDPKRQEVHLPQARRIE